MALFWCSRVLWAYFQVMGEDGELVASHQIVIYSVWDTAGSQPTLVIFLQSYC